ncbi:hypothetical protein [Lysobacter sp. HA35]
MSLVGAMAAIVWGGWLASIVYRGLRTGQLEQRGRARYVRRSVSPVYFWFLIAFFGISSLGFISIGGAMVYTLSARAVQAHSLGPNNSSKPTPLRGAA